MMQKEPLLKTILAESPNVSPAGTPRQPRSPRFQRSILNVFFYVSIIMVFACFSYTTVRFYVREVPESVDKVRSSTEHRLKEAKMYQPCQYDEEYNLPRLKKIHTWKSKRKLSDQSISVVTQLSLERLSMLQAQCKIWRDKISAVLYIPYMKNFGVISDDVRAINGSSMHDVVLFVDSFYQRMEEEGQCSLDLQLVLESFDRWDDPNIGLYPFNAVRNRGLMMVDTDVVVLLDVDFLPSKELSLMYDKRDAYQNLLRTLGEKTAYVLPAFQTVNNGVEGRNIAKKSAANGKEDIVDAWKEETVEGFQLDQYAAGHGPTQYEKWLTAQEPYSIKYEKGFEPYIMIARKFVPWYDERFRGYSRNKIVHLTHLADQLGVKLQVHDRGFVIHTPHTKASTFTRTKETGQWENLLDLYIKVRRDISVGEFVPVTAFAKHCPRVVKAENLIKKIRKKIKIKRESRIARQTSRKDISRRKSSKIKV